ncbi:Retrovirus-related Pol polyprotein from transposon 17.6, partial [Mucuna pruriens]
MRIMSPPKKAFLTIEGTTKKINKLIKEGLKRMIVEAIVGRKIDNRAKVAYYKNVGPTKEKFGSQNHYKPYSAMPSRQSGNHQGDYILVYFKTREEHVENLRIMFQVLKDKKLYVKLSKCDFWLKKVSFLGHVISRGCITINPSKIATMLEWETPEVAFKERP